MKEYLIAHLVALILGYIMDIIFGDPYQLPHPIRLIGNQIALIEKIAIGPKDKKKELSAGKEKRRGLFLVIIMLLSTAIVTCLIIVVTYKIHIGVGIFAETIMTYYILATKCLKDESMKVYYALEEGDLEKSRRAVSMIVGRDTANLDEERVAKAAIETVAENTSDGIIAPMLFTAIGGPILGFLYKTVNTMDSMVGYKNDRYINYGRYAAKLDDVLNYLPARISAYLMIISCAFLGDTFSTNKAYRIYKRDRRNHASPNSAHTEAVCAGALGIRLAGDASYFGKIVKKPYIGDEHRKVCNEDIRNANKLLYMTSFICVVICSLIIGAIICIL